MVDFYHHDTAEVSSKANIEGGVKIWNHAQIRENCSIGANSILSKNVYVDAGVSIGENVKIQNNVSVYAGVTIESEVFVGPSVVFTNDYRPRAVAPDWAIVPTLIRFGASIGANATIVCGIEIGEHAMVAAGSVVTKPVPNNALVAGNPAKIIGYVYKNGDRVDLSHMSCIEGEYITFQYPSSGESVQIPLSKVSLKFIK